MRISDWSSDVCSSDLEDGTLIWSQRDDMLDCAILLRPDEPLQPSLLVAYVGALGLGDALASTVPPGVEVNFGWPTRVAVNERDRSEEHTSELQSPMRISYAVFCLKK